MLRRAFVLSTLAAPLVRWIRPRFLVGEPNAAEQYARALDWAKPLPPEAFARFKPVWTVAIDDPAVAPWLDAARPALEAIRRARSIESCRWEPEIPTSRDLLVGRFDYRNTRVVEVACLSARRFLAQGRVHEALDDLSAALSLAHRVGTGGVLFARVFELSHEVTVFRTIGHLLPTLDRATLDELGERLAVLDRPDPASVAIDQESRFIQSAIRNRLKAAGPVLGDDDWDPELFGDSAPALQALTGGNRDRLLAHLDASIPAFTELGRRLDLPHPACRVALDAFARTEARAFPLVASMVEDAWSGRFVVDRITAFRTLIRAGVILVRDGQTAFGRERDPFGTGSLSCERVGNGFVIRSAHHEEGRTPASLEIGDPAGALFDVQP